MWIYCLRRDELREEGTHTHAVPRSGLENLIVVPVNQK